jgi:Ca2+-dependent lipid-binding protein
MSYQYIQPTDEQKDLMQVYRDKFEALSNEIKEHVEHSRGRSSCLTKLEEASFWLNKAITKNDEA